ncbi:MAG: hypothetical protein ACRC36_18850 [Lacrimispora sphenoides]
MELNELELLYLRSIIADRLDTLERRLEKHIRFYGDTDDIILKQRKIGNLEAEYAVMLDIKNRINMEIGLLSFRAQDKAKA